MATREVVLVYTHNREAFQTWAGAKKREQLRLEKERERAKQEKESERAAKDVLKAGAGGGNRTYFGSDDVDQEIIHWSDIAEESGWPHPDTGYDPWSD